MTRWDLTAVRIKVTVQLFIVDAALVFVKLYWVIDPIMPDIPA